MRSSGKDVQLRWEGSAGRQPETKLVVQVQKLEVAGQGVLGQLENHPSLAHSMPDPVDLKASVLHHTGAWSGASVALRYPKYKLPDAAAHDRLALAVIGQQVCICLAHVPSGLANAALDDWLAQWNCD
jgi:hypothetical protein